MQADKLFTPLRVGAVTLKNRVAMAPLTRLRNTEPGDVPTALAETYYAQRAGAGLIVAEGTHISPPPRVMPARPASTARRKWKPGARSMPRCTPRAA